MTARNRIFQTYGLWFLDMVCIFASYLIATWIRFGNNNEMGNKVLHFMVLVVFLLVCTMYSFFVDWNRHILTRGFFVEFMEILKFNVMMIVVSLVVVFFAQWSYILSRTVIANFTWINILLMFLVHLAYKSSMHKLLAAEFFNTKVLLVAQRATLDETIEKLHKSMGMSYQIVGSVSVDDLKGDEYRKITEKMTQIPFDEVFIYTPGLTQKDVRPLIDGFEEMGVICHYSLDLPEIAGASGTVGNFADYTVVTYSRFNKSVKKLLIKRAVDILGGLVGLLLSGVIFLFLAPIIKLDSKGPVLFSQNRVGKNGRRFRIYKFRSMYQDAEDRLKELQKQNEVQGLMFKMENDPRVTKVGRFIRKTSLDEFPQFWNILKGDMSLVGTRPPTESEFEHYDEHYRRRLSMTPGLTGLWQVSGRSNIDNFDDVVKLDLQYIDNWSLSLDFKILLQTIGVVLFHKGAK